MRSFKLLIKPFLLLFLFTCLGIFLHELSHHLSGIPSILSLSRNYPLVAISKDNLKYGIINNLVGPVTNLFLAYIGLFAYIKITKNKSLKDIAMYLGIANCFIALSGAVINLVVDLISANMGNDLEIASSLLGINIFILPTIFCFLSFIPLRIFWRDRRKAALNNISYIALIVMAWLLGGAFLIALDWIFKIRIR